MPDDVVFLIDCDNTLLDNDGLEADLRDRFTRDFGTAGWDRYRAIFVALRAEVGYSDYLGALQRYRHEAVSDTRLLPMGSFLLDYPFASRLYPGALDVLQHLGGLGTTAILSDGDVVLQPRKIERSGLWAAVGGRVLISIHKEQLLDDVAARYPARHYVVVDDKLRLLTAIKQIWRERVTTVFPRQGHYAHDSAVLATNPPADVTVECIAELMTWEEQP